VKCERLSRNSRLQTKTYKGRLSSYGCVSCTYWRTWQALKDQPAPTRQALPPADYTDAEVVPMQDIHTPGQTSRDERFAMLDQLNGHGEEESEDDG